MFCILVFDLTIPDVLKSPVKETPEYLDFDLRDMTLIIQFQEKIT